LSGEKERSSSNFALNMDYAKVICNNGISFKLKQDISVNTDRNVVYDRLKNGSCVSLKEFKNKNIYFSEPQGATSPFEVIFEPIEIKEVDTANWMSKIANKNVKLSQLSIPGTHDSGTKGISSAIAAGGGRCQNATIAQQLNDGIRFLDIRINNMQDFGESLENAVLNSAATVATKMNASGRKESLVISHGAFFCGITLGQVLEDCERFLKAHPGEVIMMSVKNDGKNNNVSPYFAQYLDCYKNLFYFTDAIPTLAQARGKIVLLYRFEFTPPSQYPEVFKKSGIRLEINNNTSTYYQNKQGVFLFIDDHYEKESCDTKKKKVFVESALNQAMSLSVPRQSARTDGGLVVPMSIDDILFITFNSIAMHSVHTPYDYAWGTAGGVVKNIDPAMNRWLKEYLINNYGNRRLGVVLMDFYDRDNENNPSDLCKLIIGQQRV
jgi:1-phosphatidylinositol phosphodiesterase